MKNALQESLPPFSRTAAALDPPPWMAAVQTGLARSIGVTESVEPESIEPESIEPESIEPESIEPESIEPARISAKPIAKRRTRRDLFEGDAAIMELQSRLAEVSGSAMPTTAIYARPAFRSPALRGAVRYVCLVAVAAAMAGAAGYVAGHARLAHRAATAAASRVANMPFTPVTHVTAPVPNPERPPAQTIAVNLSPAGPPRATVAPPDTVAAEAAQLPLKVDPKMDPGEIAARMKLGGALIAAGDVAAARTMFERIAEAGEASGAFALAETYDPAVLRTMALRGGITPDPAQARRWYEKARDMGSNTAPARLSRLAGR